MFAFLRGTLHRKSPGESVIDVGGVGYRVRTPLSTFYELGEVGEPVELRITTLVREDSISLYGFLSPGEQSLFELLIAVSGVGARMALAVLSGLSVPEAAAAVTEGDVARLRSVPGIGQKTAQRIALELRDRVGALVEGVEPAARGDTAPGVTADVISALVNLGYPEGPARRATEEAESEAGDERAFEALLRQALRRLHPR